MKEKQRNENKMAAAPMKQLFWKMGLPMIVSMVLQALYNVVDSVFVTNMGDKGALANQALTIAFPIQILMIAVGVGTGVGINALLSKSLGEQNREKASHTAGTGIFLCLCIFFVFFIFGILGAEWFISLFAGGNEEVAQMGTIYLKICCCFSLGSVGYTVFERFLQATGKTMLSTISQISGALTNIVLDYVFIFPLGMGVAGAAWATVIGQFVSLFAAMLFHYISNQEIDGRVKYIRPDFGLVKEIYKIGISAALMQALLAVMMAGMNAILGMARADQVILVGSFGIYYKIQQIALFSAFGLSNTIISILSFNYGMGDKARVKSCIRCGIFDTVLVTFILAVLFEIFAKPLSSLFGLAGGAAAQIIEICTLALRIASIGYVFMGVSVAVQGVLQSLGYAIKPLILSLLRLVVFVFPVAYLFTLSDSVSELVWWTFPIAEILTAGAATLMLHRAYKQKVTVMKGIQASEHLILSVSREHGTNGKEIARLLAQKLNIPFYDKEEIKEFALNHNLLEKDAGEKDLYDHFLSLDAGRDAMIYQSNVIKEIARTGDCVIVGRASDCILRDDPNLIKIFLYAPLDYRINTVKVLYQDDEKAARENVLKSDRSRSRYYEVVSNQVWGDKKNYDLCLDCKLGNENIVNIIYDYVHRRGDVSGI